MRGGWLPMSGRNRRNAMKPLWRMSAIEATKREIACTVLAASVKFERPDDRRGRLAADADEEKPQRVQVGGALLRRACSSTTVKPSAIRVSQGAAEPQKSNGLGVPFKTGSFP
jgi:hypothetical protein